eukprot:scaffold44920_cov38-Phaeocystis_antarctica.AAC.2
MTRCVVISAHGCMRRVAGEGPLSAVWAGGEAAFTVRSVYLTVVPVVVWSWFSFCDIKSTHTDLNA